MSENGTLQTLLDQARESLAKEEQNAQSIVQRSEELQREAAQSRLRSENLRGQVGALEAAMRGEGENPVEVPSGPPSDAVYVNPE